MYLFLATVFFLALSQFTYAQDISLDNAPICPPERFESTLASHQLLYISAGFEPEIMGGEGEPEVIRGDLEAQRDVYLFNVGTNVQQKIAEGFRRASWSPNGQQLVLVRKTIAGESLYLLDLREDTQPELLIEGGSLIEGTYNYDSINWLPNGDEIVFGITSFGDPRTYSGIYKFNLKNHLSVKMVRNIQYASYPLISPDASKIAFLKKVFNNRGFLDHYLYMMNVDGTDSHLLVSSPVVSSPAWLPDGHSIYFLQDEGNQRKLRYKVDIRNGNQELIMEDVLGTSLPNWSPNGNYATFISGDEIYRIDENGEILCRLTNHRATLESLYEEYNSDGSALIVTIGAGNWSSDANKVAYRVEVGIAYYEPETSLFLGEEYVYSEVWVMNSDGSDQNLLISEPVSQIAWRPLVNE